MSPDDDDVGTGSVVLAAGCSGCVGTVSVGVVADWDAELDVLDEGTCCCVPVLTGA